MNSVEEEIYDDSEVFSRFQDQDLRIFKAITSDPRLAVEFIANNDSGVFLGDAKQVGYLVCDYIKKYKAPPTKRVLLDQHQNAPYDVKQKIELLFDELPNVDWSPQEYIYDLEKIKQRYVDTTFNALKDDLRFNDTLSMEKTMEQMEQAISNIRKIKQPKKQTYTQKSLDEYLPEFHEQYVNRLKNPELGRGILTGYSFLDYVTNGLQPAEMMVICGETSSGKSVWLNNIAIQMWMQNNTILTNPSEYKGGCHVLYFSLEMPYAACFRRTLARLADVPIYSLRDSKLLKSEVESLKLASRFIKKYSQRCKFEIVDIARGVTPQQIEERYLEAKAKLDPRYKIVVVIDYLGLMTLPAADGDDWLQLGKLAGEVHEFGRVHDVPVVTAVQLNRVDKKKNVDPSELIGVHRVGRSSLILHHANVACQIESRRDEFLRNTFSYHVIKNRDGQLGHHEITKKFANAAIFDVPYIAPERDEMGGLISGFDDEEDISEEVKKILNLS